MQPLRIGITVYDPTTSSYYKIDRAKHLTIHGKLRTFYRLAGIAGSHPSDAWRESYELQLAPGRPALSASFL